LFGDGRIDPDFRVKLSQLDSVFVSSCARAPDGGLFLGGDLSRDGHEVVFVARVDASGTPNAVLGSSGVAVFDLGGNWHELYDIAASGSSVVLSAFGDYNAYLAKLDE